MSEEIKKTNSLEFLFKEIFNIVFKDFKSDIKSVLLNHHLLLDEEKVIVQNLIKNDDEVFLNTLEAEAYHQIVTYARRMANKNRETFSMKFFKMMEEQIKNNEEVEGVKYFKSIDYFINKDGVSFSSEDLLPTSKLQKVYKNIIKTVILNKVLKFELTNSETENVSTIYLNSYEFCADFFFLDKNYLEHIKPILSKCKLEENNTYLHDLSKKSIVLIKKMSEQEKNKDLKSIYKKLHITDKKINPYMRCIKKIKMINAFLELKKFEDLSSYEILKIFKEDKDTYALLKSVHMLKTNKGSQGLVKKIFNDIPLFYEKLNTEEKIFMFNVLKKDFNIEHNKIFSTYKDVFLKHYCDLIRNKSKEIGEFKFYNAEIRNEAEKYIILKNFENNGIDYVKKTSLTYKIPLEQFIHIVGIKRPDLCLKYSSSQIECHTIVNEKAWQSGEIIFFISGDEDLINKFNINKLIEALYNHQKTFQDINYIYKEEELFKKIFREVIINSQLDEKTTKKVRKKV